MILPARNLTFEDTGDGKTSMGFLWFESNLYSFFPIGLGELIAKLAYNILHLNFIVDTIKLVHGFINQQRWLSHDKKPTFSHLQYLLVEHANTVDQGQFFNRHDIR